LANIFKYPISVVATAAKKKAWSVLVVNTLAFTQMALTLPPWPSKARAGGWKRRGG
jgi:hypothetical protein